MFTSISGHRWNAEIGDTWICSKPTQNWTSDIESWCGSAWAGVRKHVFTLRKKADLGLPSCLFLEEVKLLCCKADAQLVRKNCLFLFRNSSLTFRHKPLRAAFWRVYGVAWAFQYKPKWKKSLASRVKQERNGWHALVRPLELTSLELTLGAHPWSSPPPIWSSWAAIPAGAMQISAEPKFPNLHFFFHCFSVNWEENFLEPSKHSHRLRIISGVWKFRNYLVSFGL